MSTKETNEDIILWNGHRCILEDYLQKLHEELSNHPECLPGMHITILRPELKYSYEICDPTRDPTKPGSLQERMRADRVFKEVIAKVNEKYELIRV